MGRFGGEHAVERTPLVGGADIGARKSEGRTRRGGEASSSAQHHDVLPRERRATSRLGSKGAYGTREDVEKGKYTDGRAMERDGWGSRRLGTGWSRTSTYGASCVALAGCAFGLLRSWCFPVDALPRSTRDFFMNQVRAKDEDISAQLSASAVFEDFCSAMRDEKACGDLRRVREGLATLDEDTYENLVSKAKTIKTDGFEDSTGFLGAYDSVVNSMVDEPRGFVSLVPHWSTAGLGFETAPESDSVQAKKLGVFVADIFPLLRKYPHWDMSDTNEIRYLTRHMNERGSPASPASLSKSETNGIIGVRPSKNENRNIAYSRFASNQGFHGSKRTPHLGSRFALHAASHGLPEKFDSRDEFPKCARLIGTTRDQGKCGSCWAVAATEVMNDRLCVATNGAAAEELSPQFALSCYDSGDGCSGGDVLDTMEIALIKGLPHGGMLDSSSCLPYEFEPCNHPCMEPGIVPQSCPSRCADGSPMQLVYPRSAPYTCPDDDIVCIAKEIYKHGSVAVTFGPVYEDFYSYKHGVYKVPDGADDPLGQHATKLIGWGKTDEGEHYWLMVNSWKNWGHDGIGKVRMGEMNVEKGIACIEM